MDVIVFAVGMLHQIGGPPEAFRQITLGLGRQELVDDPSGNSGRIVASRLEVASLERDIRRVILHDRGARLRPVGAQPDVLEPHAVRMAEVKAVGRHHRAERIGLRIVLLAFGNRLSPVAISYASAQNEVNVLEHHVPAKTATRHAGDRACNPAARTSAEVFDRHVAEVPLLPVLALARTDAQKDR